MAQHFEFTVDGMQAAVLDRLFGVHLNRLPLTLPRLDHDPVRFAQVVAIVEQALAAERLMSRGKLHRNVRVALDLVAAFRVSVTMAGTDGFDQQFAILAVSDGEQAATLAQVGTDAPPLQVTLLPDDELPGKLAAFLPPMPAGPGGELRIHAAATQPTGVAHRVDQAARDAVETDAYSNITIQTMVRSSCRASGSMSTSDQDALVNLLARPRWGSGRISVSARDTRGGIRHAEPFGWLDTDKGRHTVHTYTNDGTTTVIYEPASVDDLEQTIIDAIGRVY